MSKAVELAVRDDIESQLILHHAFEYMALLAPHEIPLQCIARYVLARYPKADEHVVIATVLK